MPTRCKVALRKESVDRNSAPRIGKTIKYVALRKESVDRNHAVQIVIVKMHASLSARRAWIEIERTSALLNGYFGSRSPQGERG